MLAESCLILPRRRLIDRVYKKSELRASAEAEGKSGELSGVERQCWIETRFGGLVPRDPLKPDQDRLCYNTEASVLQVNSL